MKIGIELHPRRGVDYVLEEARSADDQGFDSVWLSDHLFHGKGRDGPDEPLEMMTLATAIGAVTRQTRIAWGSLNITLRPPATQTAKVAGPIQTQLQAPLASKTGSNELHQAATAPRWAIRSEPTIATQTRARKAGTIASGQSEASLRRKRPPVENHRMPASNSENTRSPRSWRALLARGRAPN